MLTRQILPPPEEQQQTDSYKREQALLALKNAVIFIANRSNMPIIEPIYYLFIDVWFLAVWALGSLCKAWLKTYFKISVRPRRKLKLKIYKMLKKLRKYFISLDVLRLFRLFSFADVNWPWMQVGSGCKLILHPSRTLGRGDVKCAYYYDCRACSLSR